MCHTMTPLHQLSLLSWKSIHSNYRSPDTTRSRSRYRSTTDRFNLGLTLEDIECPGPLYRAGANENHTECNLDYQLEKMLTFTVCKQPTKMNRSLQQTEPQTNVTNHVPAYILSSIIIWYNPQYHTGVYR